ncbi:MAG: chorismate synthase [Pseudomonadota bacterium]|nr:chorismate synthase [Pseudomonadota bacterium]MDE3036930.1 chorismate synthase [Pseudomonadota bacterium]
MTFNTFGHIFRFTTWGESHGEAIGCVVDGVPSLIPLSESDIQPWLDKRRPAQSRYTTQRKESDIVKILSGVFEGKTTGAPVSLIIYNEDRKSKDYETIKDKFRPGHADYTCQAKYGIRDWRGGGRASARETAMRVAAGAIARKILSRRPHPAPRATFSQGEKEITIRGVMIGMGDDFIDRKQWDWKEIHKNPFWCPDAKAAARWAAKLDNIRKEGSSIGAVIEVVAEGVPAGLGAPIYKKLDADLAAAMMSINAVKGVEIGDGMAAAALRGEENADRMRTKGDKTIFLSNHAGGILGGISTGQPVVARFAVKPTSSILQPIETIDVHHQNTTIETRGRHDPCVGIRAVPVGEAMMACVLADHLLLHRAQRG